MGGDGDRMTTLEEAILNQPMVTGHVTTLTDVAIFIGVLAVIIAVAHYVEVRRAKRLKHAHI